VCAPTRTEPHQKDKSRNEKAPETVKQIESVCSVSVFMSHSITLSRLHVRCSELVGLYKCGHATTP
jgi:hypothetical protein